MIIEDVEDVAKKLRLKEDESFPDDDGLMFSFSAVGDSMVVSSGSFAVLLHRETGRSPFKVSHTFRSEPFRRMIDDDGTKSNRSITAVLLFPIAAAAVPKDRGNGSVNPAATLNCLAVGYDSAEVDVFSAERDLQLGKLLLTLRCQGASDQTVGATGSGLRTAAAVRKLRTNTVVSRDEGTVGAAAAPAVVTELVAVLESSTLVTIDAQSLCRCVLSAIQPGGREDDDDRRRLKLKRLLVQKSQKVDDLAALTSPNIPFDQYHRIAQSGGDPSQDKNYYIKHLNSVVSYVTVGQSPFMQVNSPHLFDPKSLGELTQDIGSTVVSGIFRAATSYLWGGSTSTPLSPAASAAAPANDHPYQKLHVRYSFKDGSKSAKCIEVSPDLRYCAILDELNRVLVLDNSTGTFIHVRKGYHHAQVGWVVASSCSALEHEDGPQHGDEFDPGSDVGDSVLLALYLPRRGTIEVRSPEKMDLVAAFNVGKRGRLVSCCPGVMTPDLQPSVTFRGRRRRPLLFGCCVFLEQDGKIFDIRVPKSCLANNDSPASHWTGHDANCLAQVRNLVREASGSQQRWTEEAQNRALELVHLIKTGQNKLSALQELLQAAVPSPHFRRILDEVEQALEASNRQQEEQQHMVDDAHQGSMAAVKAAALTRQLKSLRIVLDLYDHLHKQHGSGDGVEDGDDPDRRKFLEDFQRLMEMSGLVKVEDHGNVLDSGASDMGLSEFVSIFNVLPFKFSRDQDEVEDGATKGLLKIKKAPGETVSSSFSKLLLRACCADLQGAVDSIRDVLSWQDLLPFVLGSLVRTPGLLFIQGQHLWALFKLSLALYGSAAHEDDSGGPASPLYHLVGDMDRLMQKVLTRQNPMGLANQAAAIAWRSFLAQGCCGFACSQAQKEDWDRKLVLMEGFIKVAGHVRKGFVQQDRHRPRLDYNFREVFEEGQGGRIAEIFAGWVLQGCLEGSAVSNGVLSVEERSYLSEVVKVNPENVRQVLGNDASDYFPLCSRPVEVLLPHLAWELFRAWSHDRSQMGNAERGLECLRSVPLETDPAVILGLASILWRSFFRKDAREAVLLTNEKVSASSDPGRNRPTGISSGYRCQKLLGFPEQLMTRYLRVAQLLLKVILLLPAKDPFQKDSPGFYDQFDFGRKQPRESRDDRSQLGLHLLDHAAKIAPEVDQGQAALEYQYLTVCHFVWRFGLDIAPVSCFGPSESNWFYQEGPSAKASSHQSSWTSSLSLIGMGTEVARKQQQGFLMAACEAAASCLLPTTCLREDDQEEPLRQDEEDSAEYKEAMAEGALLAKMWRLYGPFRELQVLALYKANHDTMGAILLNSIPDKTVGVGPRLLELAIVRLARMCADLDDEDDENVGNAQECREAKPDRRNRRLDRLRQFVSASNSVLNDRLKVAQPLSKSIPRPSPEATFQLLSIVAGIEMDEYHDDLARSALALAYEIKRKR